MSPQPTPTAGWERYVPGETTLEFGGMYVVVGRRGGMLVHGQHVPDYRPEWIYKLPNYPPSAKEETQ